MADNVYRESYNDIRKQQGKPMPQSMAITAPSGNPDNKIYQLSPLDKKNIQAKTEEIIDNTKVKNG